jgi:pimeloyl-ACP methyl ester carboxylesterase
VAIMTERHPVVFIHGLWLHATSWDRWVELFVACGYPAVAPGWPGEEPTVLAARDNRGALSGRGFAQVMEHFAQIAAGPKARPVLIGHGLGGLLALTLAAEAHAAGVIAIDALPVVEMAAQAPERAHGLGAAELSRREFRMVYGKALTCLESDQLYERFAIPAPEWALREPVGPDMPAPGSAGRTTNSSRGPTLLVASGGRAAAQYVSAERGRLSAVTDVVVFAERGPSLVIDDGWREVAESCLSWMDAHEL